MPAERALGQVVERRELVPPGVREVLVEHDLAGPLRPGHDPAPAARRGGETPTSRQSWWSTWLPTPSGRYTRCGSSRTISRRRMSTGASSSARRGPAAGRRPRSRGRPRRAGRGTRPTPRRRARTARPRARRLATISPAVGGLERSSCQDRALRRDVVDERLPGERSVVDARPAVPRRALPEALRRRRRRRPGWPRAGPSVGGPRGRSSGSSAG